MGCSARRKPAPHFEPVFNAAMRPSGLFQQTVKADGYRRIVQAVISVELQSVTNRFGPDIPRLRSLISLYHKCSKGAWKVGIKTVGTVIQFPVAHARSRFQTGRTPMSAVTTPRSRMVIMPWWPLQLGLQMWSGLLKGYAAGLARIPNVKAVSAEVVPIRKSGRVP